MSLLARTSGLVQNTARVALQRRAAGDFTGVLQKFEQESAHATGTIDMWKKVSLFVAFPGIALVTYKVLQAHHEASPPEFVPFKHLRIRHKAFPWGDGNHTLFHSHLNALPDGYDH